MGSEVAQSIKRGSKKKLRNMNSKGNIWHINGIKSYKVSKELLKKARFKHNESRIVT